ncbi:MAG: class I SAM-dependent methyltransferase [Aminipila sp.]
MNTRQNKNYDKMNWLYNALYGDFSTEKLKEIEYVKDHKELLHFYDSNDLSILDSACGNGIQATALALNGYKVTATDISSQMVKLTEENAYKHGVDIETAVKGWADLPTFFSNQFDIVFCTGNSIVHSANEEERQVNLYSLSQVIKPNGTLVIETRNWDKIVKEQKTYTAYDKVSYDDNDYIPLYHWRIRGIEEEAEVTILLQQIGNNNQVKLYESILKFTPFSYITLVEQMKKLGLEIVRDTFQTDCDWYLIYGRKSR